MTDKSSIKLCSSAIEELWNNSKQAEQTPQIVIGMRRNDTDVFIITGEVTIEKQTKLK